jgi:hypothetical protein
MARMVCGRAIQRILRLIGLHPEASERHWRAYEHYQLSRRRE